MSRLSALSTEDIKTMDTSLRYNYNLLIVKSPQGSNGSISVIFICQGHNANTLFEKK